MSKKIFSTALLLATLTFSISTPASIRSDQLKWMCEHDIQKLICAGYISGVTDTIVLMSDLDYGKILPKLCMPKAGISNDQAIQLFLKFTRLNPEILHMKASIAIMAAIVSTFKCR